MDKTHHKTFLLFQLSFVNLLDEKHVFARQNKRGSYIAVLFDSVKDLKDVFVTDHVKSVRQTRLTYVVRLGQSLLCVICARSDFPEHHDVVKWRDCFFPKS